MAGLGAGAGAHQGDKDREEASLRRAQLSQQDRQFAASRDQQGRQFDASRQQQDRQFSEQVAQRQADRVQNQANIDTGREMELQRLNLGVSQHDREFGERKRQFDVNAERQGRGEQRVARLDEWDEVLKAEELKRRQLDYERNEGAYSQFLEAQKTETEQLANRKQLAQTGMASLLRLAYESPTGIAAKAAVDLFNKQNGTQIKEVFLDPQTGLFSMDADDGQGGVVPNIMDPSKQEMVLRQIYGDAVADRFFQRQTQNSSNQSRERQTAMRGAGVQKADPAEKELLRTRLKELRDDKKSFEGSTDERDSEIVDRIAEEMREVSRRLYGGDSPNETQAFWNDDGTFTWNGKEYRVGDSVKTKSGMAILTTDGWVQKK